jgi:hypothetical protein
MAMIHINRNRENLGKFNDQEVADGLKTGRFLPTDLAWREPMPTWQPLSTFTDLPEPSSEESVQIPVHGLPIESTENIEPAWERASGLSLGAAIETVRQVFSNPKTTFQNLPPTGGIHRAFFYFLFFSLLGSLCAFFYDYIVCRINPDLLINRFSDFPKINSQIQQLINSVGTHETINAIFISSAVMQPFLLIGGIFVFSLVAHFFLMLSGAAGKSFSASFKALAYSTGTGFILQIIPLVGVSISFVAFVVLGVIAMKEVHHTSYWRVILSLALMMILCSSAFAGIAVGIAGLVGQLPK